MTAGPPPFTPAVAALVKAPAAAHAQNIGINHPRRQRAMHMRTLFFTAGILLTTTLPGSTQSMTADDLKWINQCIADNKSEKGGTPEIVRKYCICMNEKMDDDETRSITQWERANPKARVACEKAAGWK